MEFIPAKHFNKGRFGNKIEAITIHHMAAKWTARQCGEFFKAGTREASSHYGIGYNGEVAQYVKEEDTAWTNGNRTSNRKSITIEVSNITLSPDWEVSDKSLDSLIKLIRDISTRHNIDLVKGKTLTWHSMFSNTTCPGPYLLSKIDYIIKEAKSMDKVYKIKYGDTLGKIAKKFDKTIDYLKHLNNIKDVNKIKAGDILIIEKGDIDNDSDKIKELEKEIETQKEINNDLKKDIINLEEELEYLTKAHNEIREKLNKFKPMTFYVIEEKGVEK